MYRAFNLTNLNWGDISRTSGDASYQGNISTVRQSLESFLENGVINGGALSAHWFPKIEANVFISHSHGDEEDAIKCASWLRDTFGLTSFIDSCVWGYSNDLLRTIDNKYCLNPGGETYDYDNRNYSTSHVHMMLAAALNETIDACECVFFLNSPRSIISAADTISETKSPWLFYELSLMRTIRRTEPKRFAVDNLVDELLENAGTKKAASMEMKHLVHLSELTKLGPFYRAFWAAKHRFNSKSLYPLDLLYDLAPVQT